MKAPPTRKASSTPARTAWKKHGNANWIANVSGQHLDVVKAGNRYLAYWNSAEAGTYSTLAKAQAAARSMLMKANPKKRNPVDMDAYAALLKKSREIGVANAETALDQRKDYTSLREAFAAYIVNAVDTAREYRGSPEMAVLAFLEHIAKPRKRRK